MKITMNPSEKKKRPSQATIYRHRKNIAILERFYQNKNQKN
jgi:hypothetical protein